MKITWGVVIVASVFVQNLANGQFVPPNAKVEPLFRTGIRISVPDEPGITLVAFHVKINEDFQGLEAGTIARDIVKTKNGRWTYEDRSTRLRLGDIVYYWVHVIYEGLGYNLLDQQHRVTEFYDPNGGQVDTRGGSGGQTCAPTVTRVVDSRTGNQREVCSGQLLIDETFDHLNETLWRTVERFPGSPDYAFVVYRNNERNVKCVDGNLEITPIQLNAEFGPDFVSTGNMTLERCTEGHGTDDCQREAFGPYILPPFSSGLLDTKNSFALTYGKIHIRAKLPHGDWIYPILSLERSDGSSSTVDPLIKIAFSTGNSILRGSTGRDFSGHVLFGGPTESNSGNGRSLNLPKRYSPSLWSDDYHIYELEWRRDRIYSRVDGVEYGSVQTKSPFDKPFYLNVGLAVGGHDEFPDSAMSDGYAKAWKNVGAKAALNFFNSIGSWSRTWIGDGTKLKIDYVKVWAL